MDLIKNYLTFWFIIYLNRKNMDPKYSNVTFICIYEISLHIVMKMEQNVFYTSGDLLWTV